MAALVLQEIGLLMELRGEDPFRAKAFARAARALDTVEGELDAAVRSGSLHSVDGLGPATVSVIEELVRSGQSSLHRSLREETPDGLVELLTVPGLSAKRVHVLRSELGVESLDDLEHAIARGRLASLPGFGVSTQQKLLEGVAFRRSVAGQRRLPDAMDVGVRLLEFLRAHPATIRVELAGGLRRRMETIDLVELVAAIDHADPWHTEQVVAAFVDVPGITRAERTADGEAVARMADGLGLRLRCAAADAFGAAWICATGSEAHLARLQERTEARGLRLDPSGLWDGEARIAAAEEAAVYDALGLAWVAPELREGDGEIEASARGELPDLLRPDQLQGCFHCHTTYSDGHATLREMAEAARARGWRYLGIADHSQAAAYAGGLDVDAIARQHDEIDAWNEDHGSQLRLFKGIEADILIDGRLDYADADEDVLARFDYVVASVHSAFGQSEAKMTARFIRAIENPHLTFLGHPTGRRLLARDGVQIDMAAVIDAAAERGVGIEINANPRRLDMDWRHWRAAKTKGVRTAINPDAHSLPELDYVHHGVDVARKGWLTPDDVVNAWGVDDVQRYFEHARGS